MFSALSWYSDLNHLQIGPRPLHVCFKPLSKHVSEPLRCHLISLGLDMRRRDFIGLLGGAVPVVATARNASGLTATKTAVIGATVSSAFPDGTNTGVSPGTVLTASPYIAARAPGQIISGKDITGGVDILASNVTVQNCKIFAGAEANWIVSIADGLDGVVLKNCEIYGAGSTATSQNAGVYVKGDSNVIFDAVNVHHVGHGIDVSGGPVVIKNSYIHDLKAASTSHYDCVYCGGNNGAAFSLLIENSRLLNTNNTQTAALFIENYFGKIHDITVTGCHLGGGGYTTYCNATPNNGAGGAFVSASYTNNAFTKGVYGYISFRNCNPVFTGNYDFATGIPIKWRS
jgi:hypothetical protein